MKEQHRGKKNDHKMKPYLVLQYLIKETDEDHVARASEIIGHLEEIGISAERRSIYKDIEEINKAWAIIQEDAETIEEAAELIEDDDYKLILYNTHDKGFYIRDRRYDISDIRMLAQCIYSSRFITEKQSKQLIDVICDHVSEYQASGIKHEVYLTDRVKTDNNTIYYNVSTISEAMSRLLDGKKHTPEKISFKYLKCTIQNATNKVERRADKQHVVSPYHLVINDGNYYMIGFDDAAHKILTFRVDRIKDVKRLGEARNGEDMFKDFRIESYAQQHFSMFSGSEERVSIRFANSLLDTVVDRFGTKNVVYNRDGEGYFKLFASVAVSDQFFGWLCGLGTKAQIVSPDSVVDKFSSYLDNLRKMYNS